MSGPRPTVLYFIDSLSVGGAESSLVALARQYLVLGVELHVSYLRPRTHLSDDLLAAGATLHPLVGQQDRVSWIRGARRLIRELEPDVVHTTLFEADIVGRFAAMFIDVPVVSSLVTESSYGPDHLANPEYRRWKVRFAQVLDLVSAMRVDQFHAVSGSTASLVGGRLGINRERIRVVPRGRDSRILGERTPERRRRAREKLGVAESTRMILAVARHHHVKGLDTLLSAFAETVRSVSDVVLFLAGREGPLTDTLVTIARESGIEDRVAFLGLRDDVPDLLAAADLFVLPSRAEGSPGALMEAMALDLPAVASDIPSVREIAGTPPVVTLFPVEDHDSLGQELIRLLGDRESMGQLAKTARDRFDEVFAIERVSRAMIGVYAEAAARRRADDSVWLRLQRESERASPAEGSTSAQ